LIEVFVEHADAPLALTDTLVVVGQLIGFLDPFYHETNILETFHSFLKVSGLKKSETD
jgi:hypothetical protein